MNSSKEGANDDVRGQLTFRRETEQTRRKGSSMLSHIFFSVYQRIRNRDSCLIKLESGYVT